MSPFDTTPPAAAPENTLRLVLPWSVLESVNQRTNPAGWGKMKGRQFLTRRYRTALDGARARVLAQVPGARPRFRDGRVAVELRFWLPGARRRDCGNYVKLPEDALTGTVYRDDSQIQCLTWIECGIDRANPRVEIQVAAVAAVAWPELGVRHV